MSFIITDTFCILGPYVMKVHFNIILTSLFAHAFQMILRYFVQVVGYSYICDFHYACCMSQLSRPYRFNHGFPLVHNSVSPPAPCSQLFCRTKRSNYKLVAMPCHVSVTQLAPCYFRPEFNCGPVSVGFVVDKVALR